MRKTFKFTSLSVSVLAVGYMLLLYFPQPLFGYSTEYGGFRVHSREPSGQELTAVLDNAELRLRRSPLYDSSLSRNIYLTDSFGMYALLSHKAYKSFANSVPFIDNIIVNKSDPAADCVFANREKNNSRSLSGVIAHEVTHLFIRQRYGTVAAILMPAWQSEGYCEYIARDSTITLNDGARLWRENPSDDAAYPYIKYLLMVKYLLEHEKMTVDELFTKPLDEKEVADRTFTNLGK